MSGDGAVQPPGRRLRGRPSCALLDFEWFILRHRAYAVSWRCPRRRYRARL